MKLWGKVAIFAMATAASVGVLVWFGLPFTPLSRAADGRPVARPASGYPPPTPEVSQILVTLRQVEVNKDKEGRGSPWRTIVPDSKTFDLLAVGGTGVPDFLGKALAEAGTYRIIRMVLQGVTVVEGGQLIGAKVPSSKIQIVERFEVQAGRTTRLRIDFDSRKLTRTGAGQFIFKPEAQLTVLPPVEGVSALGGDSAPVGRGRLAAPLAATDGAIQVLAGESQISRNVQGRLLLQGRPQARNEGTIITLTKDGVAVDLASATAEDGSFSLNLGDGSYQLKATQPGWLPRVVTFVIQAGQQVDLATLVMLAGDADGDGDIDRGDLMLYARRLGKPPLADAFTDVDGDGVTSIIDLAHAARNFGR